MTGSEIQAALLTVSRETRKGSARRKDLQETDCNVRRRIDEANKPRVLAADCGGRAVLRIVRDAHLDRESEIGSIRTGLIPALDTSSNRVEDNGDIEDSWVLPLAGNLLS